MKKMFQNLSFDLIAVLVISVLAVMIGWGISKHALPLPMRSPEPDKTQMVSVSIQNGAQSANKEGQVNSLRVYDPDSDDLAEYTDGSKAPIGSHVAVYTYNLASDVHLSIRHDGQTVADDDIPRLESDRKVKIYDVILKGNLAIETKEINLKNLQKIATVHVNDGSLAELTSDGRAIKDGEDLAFGRRSIQIRPTDKDLKAQIRIGDRLVTDQVILKGQSASIDDLSVDGDLFFDLRPASDEEVTEVREAEEKAAREAEEKAARERAIREKAERDRRAAEKRKTNQTNQTKPTEGGQVKPDDSGQSKPDDGGQVSPGDGGQSKPDDGGQVKPDDDGHSKPDDGGQVKPDDSGHSKPDDGGQVSPGDGGHSKPDDGGQVSPDDEDDSESDATVTIQDRSGRLFVALLTGSDQDSSERNPENMNLISSGTRLPIGSRIKIYKYFNPDYPRLRVIHNGKCIVDIGDYPAGTVDALDTVELTLEGDLFVSTGPSKQVCL